MENKIHPMLCVCSFSGYLWKISEKNFFWKTFGQKLFGLFDFTSFVFWRICQKFGEQLSNIKSSAQLTFTCSKTAIETLEKGVKYVQS